MSLSDLTSNLNQLSTTDYFVDDKAVNALDWLEDEEKAIRRVETEDPIKNIQIFDPLHPYGHEALRKKGDN